ncbi:hypothetical protein SUGI_1180900 [Cryptomeria japonica]|nr:hypothetical protein SUGI_1180900 [Cryptomeria japonica]
MIFAQHGLLAVFAQKGVMDCSNNHHIRFKECLILASDGVWYIVSTDVPCEVSYRCLVFHSRGRRNGNKVKSGESSTFGTKVDKHFNNSVKVKLKARDVFEKTPEPNLFSSNTSIVDVVFGMVDMGKNVVNDKSTSATIINEEEWLVAIELGFFTCLPVAINVVIELDALQIITNAGDGLQVSRAQIVSQILNVTNPDATITLDRNLRVLAVHSLLSCSVTIDNNGKPERLYGSQPFTKAHGVNAFEYPAKERTEEFKDLAKARGFARGVKPICCVNGVWVIEFHK